MQKVIKGLNNAIDDDDLRKETVRAVADYMRQRIQLRGEHTSWAVKFFICECLNFINVICQVSGHLNILHLNN